MPRFGSREARAFNIWSACSVDARKLDWIERTSITFIIGGTRWEGSEGWKKDTGEGFTGQGRQRTIVFQRNLQRFPFFWGGGGAKV